MACSSEEELLLLLPLVSLFIHVMTPAVQSPPLFVLFSFLSLVSLLCLSCNQSGQGNRMRMRALGADVVVLSANVSRRGTSACFGGSVVNHRQDVRVTAAAQHLHSCHHRPSLPPPPRAASGSESTYCQLRPFLPRECSPYPPRRWEVDSRRGWLDHALDGCEVPLRWSPYHRHCRCHRHPSYPRRQDSLWSLTYT